LACVLQRGQAPVMVPLDASRPVACAVRAWRQALEAGKPARQVAAYCETGLGMLEYGHEVMGPQRSFQAVGARAVVASLWKVDDAATLC
jgi:hypothetical protein